MSTPREIIRAPEPSGRIESTRWLQVAALVSAGVAVALLIGKEVAALPTQAAELGLSLTLGGWMLGAFNIAGTLGGLGIGAGIDHFGHRRCLLLGLILAAACSALGALAHDAPLLLASRIGEGLGLVVTAMSVPSLLLNVVTPTDRGIVFGIWSSFIPIGTAVGILIGPPLLAAVGWRGLWLCTAALVAASAMIVATMTIPEKSQPRVIATGVWATIYAVLSSPAPLLAAGIFVAFAAQYLSVFGFLPTLLSTQNHLSAGSAAILTAIAVALHIPGSVLGGTLHGRGVPDWVLICAASAIMALAAAAIYTGEFPFGLRYGGCVALSLASGIIPGSLTAAAPELAPNPHAVAATIGVLSQGAMLGQTLGPPAIAELATTTGSWQASPVLLGLSAAMAAGLSIALHYTQRRHRLRLGDLRL